MGHTAMIKILFGEGFTFYTLLSHIFPPSSFRRKGQGRWVPTVQVKKLTSEGAAISVGMAGRDSNPGPDWRRGRGYAFAPRGRGSPHPALALVKQSSLIGFQTQLWLEQFQVESFLYWGLTPSFLEPSPQNPLSLRGPQSKARHAFQNPV